MAERKAEAVWHGSLKEGEGKMKLGSGAYEGKFTHASRFEEGDGTNPEELIGAALAGCFSMSLSSNLGKNDFTPRKVSTRAKVRLEKVEGKNRITKIHLDNETEVVGISEEKFQEVAQYAKSSCPVSVALQGVEITLNSKLIKVEETN